MSRVVRSPISRQDMRQIARYIRKQGGSRQTAFAFLERLNGCLNVLATQPMMGRGRDDLRPGLRSYPIENYLIIYRPLDDGIEVIRVLHAARDVDAMFH